MARDLAEWGRWWATRADKRPPRSQRTPQVSARTSVLRSAARRSGAPPRWVAGGARLRALLRRSPCDGKFTRKKEVIDEEEAVRAGINQRRAVRIFGCFEWLLHRNQLSVADVEGV